MENCIFCKIIAGEIPGKIVYENDKVMAFDDVNPQAPVHVLVVPKKHYANILEAHADHEITAALMDAVAEVAKIKGLEEGGFRLIANTGKNAGQTVNHLHFHVLGGAAFSDKIL